MKRWWIVIVLAVASLLLIAADRKISDLPQLINPGVAPGMKFNGHEMFPVFSTNAGGVYMLTNYYIRLDDFGEWILTGVPVQTNIFQTTITTNLTVYETNITSYQITTNLTVVNTNVVNYQITTNLIVYQTNIVNNSFVTNQTIYQTNIVNWEITTNLTVFQTNLVNQTITTNLTVLETNINNYQITTNLYVYNNISVTSNVWITNILQAKTAYITNLIVQDLFRTNRTVTIATNADSATLDFLSAKDWYEVPVFMNTNLVLSPTNLMAGREVWVFFSAANGNYDVTITNTAATDIRWNLNSPTNGSTSFTVTNNQRLELAILCRSNNILQAVYGHYR